MMLTAWENPWLSSDGSLRSKMFREPDHPAFQDSPEPGFICVVIDGRRRRLRLQRPDERDNDLLCARVESFDFGSHIRREDIGVSHCC